MPAPTNISFATAVELGPFPNTITQDVNFAGTSYAVYYKYTATATGMVSVLAVGNAAAPANYVAAVNVYEPDQVTLLISNLNDQPGQLPVVNGSIYYFAIFSLNGNVTPATLTISGVSAPTVPAVVDDLLVTDDQEAPNGTSGWWAAVLSQTDGTVKKFLPTVNGEFGDILPNGIFCLTNDDEGGATHAYIYAANGTVVGNALNIGGTATVRSNGVNKFYVANDALISTVSTTATVGGTTWTLPSIPTAIAPSRDDTILYWSAGTGVKRWDLVNNIALTDLVGASPASHLPGLDMLVFANGHILVTWQNVAGNDYFFREYTTAGATVRDYTFSLPSGRTDGPRTAINGLDDSSSFWGWASGVVSGNVTSKFQKFKTSDGSTLVTFSPYVFERGVGPSLASGRPTFGNSKSCPFFALRANNIAAGASITVIKVIDPPGDTTTVFPFGASGGLSPTSFSLTSVTSQTYGSVTPGSGYAIFETPPDGWAVSYTVSNASPVNDITVGTNENVTVTATNTPVSVANTDPIRRLRQTAHLSTEQVWLFFSKFQLDCEAGVGLNTGQGSDPQVMLSWSDDGGHTWSAEQWMSAGKIGEYKRRVIWRRLGRSRDRVWKIVVSDPVAWRLLAAYIDVKKGTS